MSRCMQTLDPSRDLATKIRTSRSTWSEMKGLPPTGRKFRLIDEPLHADTRPQQGLGDKNAHKSFHMVGDEGSPPNRQEVQAHRWAVACRHSTPAGTWRQKSAQVVP